MRYVTITDHRPHTQFGKHYRMESLSCGHVRLARPSNPVPRGPVACMEAHMPVFPPDPPPPLAPEALARTVEEAVQEIRAAREATSKAFEGLRVLVREYLGGQP